VKPRIGVIGYGLMGQLLARIVAEHPEAQLAGVADPVGYRETCPIGQRVSRSPEELDVRLYGDYADLLQQEEPTAVVVATPEDVHVEPILRAVEAGCDVFVEKPIARNLKEADCIIDGCREAGRKLMVGYTLRFEPAYIALKDACAAGKLGVLRSIYGRRNVNRVEANRLAGRTNVTNYIAVHDIDQMLWYHEGVAVKSVYAKAIRGRVDELYGTWDSSWILFEFVDGAVGIVETGWGVPENAWVDCKMNIIGTDGAIALDLVPMNVMSVDNDGWHFPLTRVRTEVNGKIVGALQYEVSHFIDCLIEDKDPSIDGNEARRSLEIAEAAELSIAEERQVSLG